MGENNSEKLTLPSGIPESVEDLKLEISCRGLPATIHGR